MSKICSSSARHQFREDCASKSDNILVKTKTTIKNSVDMIDYCSETKRSSDISCVMINLVLQCMETMLNLELKDVFENRKRKKFKWVNDAIKDNIHNMQDEEEFKRDIKRIFSKKYSIRDVLYYFSKVINYKFKINDYARIHDTGYHNSTGKKKTVKTRKDVLNTIKTVLSNNIPIISVLKMPKSFENTKTGIVENRDVFFKYPVLLVGYSDHLESLIFQNSWGKNWGDKGFGYIPYKVFIQTKLLDCWVITDIIYNEHTYLYPKTGRFEDVKIEIPLLSTESNKENVFSRDDGTDQERETDAI